MAACFASKVFAGSLRLRRLDVRRGYASPLRRKERSGCARRMAFGPNWAKPEPRAQTYMTTKGSRRGIASLSSRRQSRIMATLELRPRWHHRSARAMRDFFSVKVPLASFLRG